MNTYIPDLTERYPEGFNGVDMFEPYDIEAAMWADMERQYKEDERREIERINRAGFKVIEQDFSGWTFAETDERLILFNIDPKSGEIKSIYDSARNKPENRKSMFETWQEISKENAERGREQ